MIRQRTGRIGVKAVGFVTGKEHSHAKEIITTRVVVISGSDLLH